MHDESLQGVTLANNVFFMPFAFTQTVSLLSFVCLPIYIAIGLHSCREVAFITHWVNPLGIEYATEAIYTALHDVQSKVVDKIQSLSADFGR